MFSNLETVGLFIFAIAIGVSSKFQFQYCQPMDDNRVSKCFFFHKVVNASNDRQNVTLCLKPKETLRIDLNDTRVEEKTTFNLTDLLAIDKWSFLTIATIVQKGADESVRQDADEEVTMQYNFNGRSFPELILPGIPTDSNHEIGLIFHGEFEASLHDDEPCVTQIDPLTGPLAPENKVYQNIAIVFLLLTGLFAVVIIILLRKAWLAKEVKKKEAATKTGRGESYYGNYENKKIKPKLEYTEGIYEDDTYELEPAQPPEQSIEEKAKALNKSVIEVHFGL